MCRRKTRSYLGKEGSREMGQHVQRSKMTMAGMELFMSSVEGSVVTDRSGCSCFTWFPFCSAATAFLINKVPLPVSNALPLPLDNILTLDPLKLLLKTLGISVEHLIEALRKSVNELTPEASEAVKKLLVTTAYREVDERAGFCDPECLCCPLHSPPPFLTLECVFPPTDYSSKVCVFQTLKESTISTFLVGVFE